MTDEQQKIIDFLTKLVEDYKAENESLRERVETLEAIESAILENRLMLVTSEAQIYFDQPLKPSKQINVEAGAFGNLAIEEIWERVVKL